MVVTGSYQREKIMFILITICKSLWQIVPISTGVRDGGQLPPPPPLPATKIKKVGKPRISEQMLCKINNIGANISETMLNSGYYTDLKGQVS